MLRTKEYLAGKQPPLSIAVLVALILVSASAALRLGLVPHTILPIGFGVPVVIVAIFRYRHLLWMTVAVFVVLTIIKYGYILSAGADAIAIAQFRWSSLMVLVDLLIVGAMADNWIRAEQRLRNRNAELESINSELATREEEIARQNEELQSQTEELERQSEELRISNEELVRREKTLEVLLSLSRALTTELSRGDMMGRICQTLGLIVNGTAAASAILEQDGDMLHVRCHHGFGTGGIAAEINSTESIFWLAGIVTRPHRLSGRHRACGLT